MRSSDSFYLIAIVCQTNHRQSIIDLQSPRQSSQTNTVSERINKNTNKNTHNKHTQPERVKMEERAHKRERERQKWVQKWQEQRDEVTIVYRLKLAAVMLLAASPAIALYKCVWVCVWVGGGAWEREKKRAGKRVRIACAALLAGL